jgi:hypothetical protein
MVVDIQPDKLASRTNPPDILAVFAEAPEPMDTLLPPSSLYYNPSQIFLNGVAGGC